MSDLQIYPMQTITLQNTIYFATVKLKYTLVNQTETGYFKDEDFKYIYRFFL